MNNSENEYKRRGAFARSISINSAARSKEPHEVTEDTKIRKEINKIILTGIVRKRSKLEILLELGSNPKYKKYDQYFRIWINEQYQKYHDYSEKEEVEDESDRTL